MKIDIGNEGYYVMVRKVSDKDISSYIINVKYHWKEDPFPFKSENRKTIIIVKHSENDKVNNKIEKRKTLSIYNKEKCIFSCMANEVGYIQQRVYEEEQIIINIELVNNGEILINNGKIMEE